MAENNIVQRLEQSVEKLLEQYTLSAEEVARLQMLTAAQQRKIRTLQQQLSDAERRWRRLNSLRLWPQMVAIPRQREHRLTVYCGRLTSV